MRPDRVARFEQLILPHLDAGYTLARYLLRHEHDAQDVTQDAALRAYRHFDTYRDGDPRAWFLAIVRNCCFTWLKKGRDRATAPMLPYLDRVPDPSREADALALTNSDRAAIQRAVADLAPEFREVIVLRELQELSYAEISVVIDAPIGTVMSRLSRARKRLAERLGGLIDKAS